MINEELTKAIITIANNANQLINPVNTDLLGDIWIFTCIVTTSIMLYAGTKIKKNNKFIVFNAILLTLIIMLCILIIASTIANINGINLGISILNFSALGIMLSVLLTMSYNFYLKEDDKIKDIQYCYKLLIEQKHLIALIKTHIRKRKTPFETQYGIKPVSYTHLDVYKRQL